MGHLNRSSCFCMLLFCRATVSSLARVVFLFFVFLTSQPYIPSSFRVGIVKNPGNDLAKMLSKLLPDWNFTSWEESQLNLISINTFTYEQNNRSRMVLKYVLAHLIPKTNPSTNFFPVCPFVKYVAREIKVNIRYYFSAEIIISTE